LLLSACSSTTFIYNRLDFILPWYLDDYAQLNSEQDIYLEELISPFLAWHRSEELPRYLLILEQIDSSLERQLGPDDVADIAAQLEAAWYRLEGEALDWLLDLGAELSDEQVQDFLEELQEQQSEYEKKYLKRPEEDFREDSYDSLLDSMQDYLGRLDSKQRAVLREASEGLMRSDLTWLTERAAWLQRLGVMMQREPGWQQRIRDASAAKNETVSAEYLRIYEHNTRLIYRAVADTLNSRSSKQDGRLRGKLDALREDLQILIAQGA
jgi:cation transport regulator ChaC